MSSESRFPTAVTTVAMFDTKGDIASGNGNIIDLQDYDGLGLITVCVSLGTTSDETLALTIYHDDAANMGTQALVPVGVMASSGGGFTTIEDDSAAAVRLQSKVIDVAKAKRYLRATFVAAGTSPNFTGSVIFQGIKKHR